MRSNCGWARLLDTQSDEIVARGRVFISAHPEARLTYGGDAGWRGEIDLVRPEGLPLQDGTYTLAFEAGLAHVVRVRGVAVREEPSGAYASASLLGTDAVELAVLTELGGEE